MLKRLRLVDGGANEDHGPESDATSIQVETLVQPFTDKFEGQGELLAATQALEDIEGSSAAAANPCRTLPPKASLRPSSIF